MAILDLLYGSYCKDNVALWVNKPNVDWNALVSNETNEDVRMYT